MNYFSDKVNFINQYVSHIEIWFMIFVLIVLLIRKYQLQNQVNNIKPSVKTLTYISKENNYLLVPDVNILEYTSDGWKVLFSFFVFEGKYMNASKFIVYDNNGMLIVKEGESISVDSVKKYEFFAFSTFEDVPKHIKTNSIIIGYNKNNEKENSIICLKNKDCITSDRTQIMYVPLINNN